jgi:hypothetical protein
MDLEVWSLNEDIMVVLNHLFFRLCMLFKQNSNFMWFYGYSLC